MSEENWEYIRNFKPKEFQCTCCGADGMDLYFMNKLQELRDLFGAPMIITSGYRCKNHPAEKNKSVPGSHNQGKAVDILVNRSDAFLLIKLAMQMGFTGLGVNQKGDDRSRFIHLDTADDKLRPTVWSY